MMKYEIMPFASKNDFLFFWNDLKIMTFFIDHIIFLMNDRT